MNIMSKSKPKTIHWICDDCALKYGGRLVDALNWYNYDICEVCGREQPITQIRKWRDIAFPPEFENPYSQRLYM